MSSELAFKTTSDLEAHKKQLISQLTTLKMELSKRSKLDAAVKRLATANIAITEAKGHLRDTYWMHDEACWMHEEAKREDQRAMENMWWWGVELDSARQAVRSCIRRKRRANKALKKLRDTYPPLPCSPRCEAEYPEAIWSPQDDEIAAYPNRSINLNTIQVENHGPYTPVSQCDTFLDAEISMQGQERPCPELTAKLNSLLGRCGKCNNLNESCQCAPKETKSCGVWCEICCQCPPSPTPMAQKADVLYRRGDWLDEWMNGSPLTSKNHVLNSPPQIYRMSEDTKDKLAAAFGWKGREKGTQEKELPCVKHHETVARCFCKSCTQELERPKTMEELDEEEERRAMWEDRRKG